MVERFDNDEFSCHVSSQNLSSLSLTCPGAGSVDDMLDAENKRLADNLASKVSRLKSVSPHPSPSRITSNEWVPVRGERTIMYSFMVSL